jgi:cellulose synthase/poly-beta-1,6-N-acetylglucosamine synthase-like glycosyltransferase
MEFEHAAEPKPVARPADGSRASVIIPIYNDADRLGTCLAALEAQTYPRSEFEIIVVDNGSTDNVAEVARRFPRVRLLSEPTPGSYAARNRGLAVATGDVIAFTDSDCIPGPQWLANGIAALRRDDRCGLVAGGIRVTFALPEHPTLCELYDSVFDFDQERFIARSKFGCTANALTRGRVLRDVGLFDGRMRSVGDRDLGNRIAAAGYRLVFANEAVVSHPGRRTVRDLLRKRLRVAGGHHHRASRRSWPRLRLLHALARQILWNPFSGAGRIWRRGRHLSFGTKVRLLGLYVFLCQAESVERIRLLFGGEPVR